MRNKVGNDGRARTALWQRIFVTCDLGYDGGNPFLKRNISVFETEAANPGEVERRVEIFEIDIKNPSSIPMLSRVGENRPITFEAVGYLVLALVTRTDLIVAVLK
jgi:hypothetical protein